jgi:DNA helicase-2/ATP-dependent DNA helicase PcrA
VTFYADLHVHSKHSRACSRDCDLEHLAWWAARKGIAVVGTGDFTHPGWVEELRAQLVPAEPGLFRLRPELERAVLDRLPPACRVPVRFLLSSEISTIYKRDDRTRKVHHLLYAPGFDQVADITSRLARIGNLASDGRPILGLDSRDLLEITLEAGNGCYLVPAHVWTPWFAALGSQSGFDAIEDCYVDLAEHVFAAETGLSSDPEMNWRVSGLDRYRLVSNSDAHSPPMLGREATAFDTELDYFALAHALRTGEGFGGTVEFFPEEGKYHLDGHRACDVRLEPDETRELSGRCPVCSKPLTVGVLHRVEALADRPAGHRPDDADPFRSFVPLPEVVGEILGVGPKSKTVDRQVNHLVGRLGPEMAILGEIPLHEVAGAGSSLLVEALDRLRRGEVRRDAGYDGVYGTIRLFEPDELSDPALFHVGFGPDDAPAAGGRTRPAAVAGAPARPAEAPAPDRTDANGAGVGSVGTGTTDAERGDQPPDRILDGLDPEQRAVALTAGGPVLVVAGPGTGKTRVLTHRLAHRIETGAVAADGCLVLTFTRRACAELRERLAALVPAHAPRILVTTFHGLGLQLVREQHDQLGLPPAVRVIDEATRLALVAEIRPGPDREIRRLASALADRKRRAGTPAVDGGDLGDLDPLAERYDKELRRRGWVDLDDLVALPVALLEGRPDLVEQCRDRWPDLSVDEYQDVDGLQYRLLRLLSRPDGNLCAIGDPDQAIYGFRGGDVGYFLRFKQDFPTARVVRLERNYRSAPTIVRAALEAVAPSSLVPGRRLTPVRVDMDDAPIVAWRTGNEQSEAEVVASTVERLIGGTSFLAFDRGASDGSATHHLSFSDFAVLSRTAAQAGPVVEALARRGFPVQRCSHDRLADRPDVRAVLAALPAGKGTGTGSDPGSVVDRIQAAATLALEREAADEPGTTPDAIAAVPALLRPLAVECGHDLDRFLTELALGVEVDTWDPRADRVAVMTLHAAKGLEFPVVFIVGCEDGMLPFRHRPGDEDSPDDAEERRLLFVGMTRATTRLVVTTARTRLRWGAVREASPSPFLEAIGEGHLVWRQGLAGEGARERPAHRQLRLL